VHHPGPVVSRFRYFRDPLCILGCAAYALNRWGVKPLSADGFLHSYFNDLWLIPCALPLLLWLQRRVGLRRHDGMPTGSEILGALAVWSVLFEALGPRWMPVTGDPLDVVAYGVGGLAAWLWWRRIHEL